MPKLNRRHLMALGLGALTPLPAFGQEPDLLAAQMNLIFGNKEKFEAGLELIRTRGTPDMAAGLITAMRFTRAPQGIIAQVLQEITGQEIGADWFEWMLWQENHPEIIPHASYAAFKRQALLQIDPNFDDFLRPEYLDPKDMHIRLEEVTWGGVRKDGIPSLDNPVMIGADTADYLRDDDLVFGVSINGDTRAYPLRIMGWHEMFNDVIGGVPVALAYCTLCGSGILFETQVPGRAEALVFGSSGFLYRSNKLMFDRATNSLWNQYTGRPVIGPLASSDITLQQRPVVITPWADWRAENPGTTVLGLNTGHNRNYGSGVVYRDYFASGNLMFPAKVDQSVHAQKDYVFAVRQFGANKAWPLNAFDGRPVINDAIGTTPLVLLGDPNKRSVRAYERGERHFTDDLRDETGAQWTLSEDALTAPDGTALPRVAGHISYWFAWNNYMGVEGEVFDG